MQRPGTAAIQRARRAALARQGFGLVRAFGSAYASRTDTLTFLFTDIEGSTSLLKRVGQEAYARVLADHDRLIRAGISAHGGREVNITGDGFFAVFSSASGGVAAVIETQLALGEYDWPASARIRVRMGLHSGEATETPGIDCPNPNDRGRQQGSCRPSPVRSRQKLPSSRPAGLQGTASACSAC